MVAAYPASAPADRDICVPQPKIKYKPGARDSCGFCACRSNKGHIASAKVPTAARRT